MNGQFQNRLAFFDTEMLTPEVVAQVAVTDTAFFEVNGNVRAIHTVRDNFYVAYDNGTIIIEPDQTVTELNGIIFYRMFELNGALFGFFNGQLYQTEDGVNFSEAGQADLVLNQLQYYSLQDRTIASYNSQLFEFTLNASDEIRATELENEGLFGHEITSVAALDSTVYVATLSGVFTKPLENFFEAKEPEEENAGARSSDLPRLFKE